MPFLQTYTCTCVMLAVTTRHPTAFAARFTSSGGEKTPLLHSSNGNNSLVGMATKIHEHNRRLINIFSWTTAVAEGLTKLEDAATDTTIDLRSGRKARKKKAQRLRGHGSNGEAAQSQAEKDVASKARYLSVGVCVGLCSVVWLQQCWWRWLW